MKNLSLEITSPKFLDDSFTTQMDLVSGKVFYHSQLGEYLNMLPPIISDAIEKAIWKFIYSSKVLAIPHPIHIDYYDDHTMKQDVQSYIDMNKKSRYWTYTLMKDQTRQTGEQQPHRHPRVAKAFDYLTGAREIQPSDVAKICPSRTEYRNPRDRPKLNDTIRIKKAMINNTTFSEQPQVTNLLPILCMGFNNDGCMCGVCDKYTEFLPDSLVDKYAPLDGKFGFETSTPNWSHVPDWALRRRPRVSLKMCSKHMAAMEVERWVEENRLDKYLEQHNYYYRNGYWVMGNPKDGYSLNKKGKKVPHEAISIRMRRGEVAPLREKLSSTLRSRNTESALARYDAEFNKQVYLPKLSKRAQKNM